MTSSQINLVQSTWTQVTSTAETAAGLLYGRLLELDPSLLSLFPSDLTAQGKKLMTMLTVAVRGLDDLGKLNPTVQDLGQRHIAYGVKSVHYDTVGAALLWTLRQGLGEAFTPEVETAWTEVYGVLASTMQQGAATHDNKS
ncbi:MAG: hypothetical protein J6386_23500 [Candidatus Synoicihabitans palmerolidicus]|nr:hypothetical protein [Candidatus Synoicihabitans palmerolidicus]